MSTKYEPLTSENKRHLSELLSSLALHAANPGHPMHTHATHLVSTICWYWTADGYDPERRKVKRDAFKYDWNRLRYTAAAEEHWEKNIEERKLDSKCSPFSGIQHDHAVPRKVLIGLIIRDELDAQGIERMMSKLCVGVLVTKDEHSLKLRRDSMPPGWDEDDPYARYSDANISLLP